MDNKAYLDYQLQSVKAKILRKDLISLYPDDEEKTVFIKALKDHIITREEYDLLKMFY